MEEGEEGRGQNKLYRSAAFLCHLLSLGQQNITRTPTILKTGILMLNTSLILYFVGFVSPYWVDGEKRPYTHDPSGKMLVNDGAETDGNSASSLFAANDTHFGLWEECGVVQGRSVCSIFTEDIDSVVLMFGCVGGIILCGLCCWSCLSCLRKPKKSRYYLIVISAVVGGFFGFVSIFIFTAAQGAKRYSWAFALFLSGCMLELCAAVVFLWGVRLATAQGFFPPSLPDPEDATPHPLPTIIVTGPTPTRKDQHRSVRVLNRPSKTKSPARWHQHQHEDHVDFITLEMVTPVPSQPSEQKRKKKKKKKRKAEGCSRNMREERAVESLARRVAEHHRSYVDLASSAPPPRPSSASKLNVSASDANQPLLYRTEANQNIRPASVYIDLTGSTPKVTSRRRHSEASERNRKTSRELKISHRSTYSHSEDKPRQKAHTSFRLSVDVHHSDDLTETLENTGDDPALEHLPTTSPIKSGNDDPLQLMPPAQVQSTLPIPGRKSEMYLTSEANAKSVVTPPPPISGSTDRRISDTASERWGRVRKQNGEQEENQYMRYSPDTYHITTNFDFLK